MKKTLLSCAALLVALSTVGCEPPAAPNVSTDVTAPAADSNVTATAETPAMTETPAAAEAVVEEAVVEESVVEEAVVEEVKAE